MIFCSLGTELFEAVVFSWLGEGLYQMKMFKFAEGQFVFTCKLAGKWQALGLLGSLFSEPCCSLSH